MKLDAAMFAAVAILVGVMANAARAEDRPDCNGVAYSEGHSNISLGIVAGGKVHFLANGSEKAGCPSASAACRKRAFLVDDNHVVIDAETAGSAYVCASYIDARGNETDGWLPAGSVKTVTAPPAWIGAWKRDTTSAIDITRKSDNTVEIIGHATYGQGAATHEGDIGAILDASKASQGFATEFAGDKQIPYEKAAPEDCAVMMSQLGPYLFVSDSGNCGGANVSFFGLYARR
jgi:hypothetical protein